MGHNYRKLSSFILLSAFSFCLFHCAARPGLEEGSYSNSNSPDSPSAAKSTASPIDADELKEQVEKTTNQLTAQEQANHELRKQIFDAKVQLGIPQEHAADSSATTNSADAASTTPSSSNGTISTKSNASSSHHSDDDANTNTSKSNKSGKSHKKKK